MGLYALTTGDVSGIAMAGTGLFNWRQVLMNLVGATAITITFALVTDIFLGPLGMALAGLGLGSWTTEQAPSQGAGHHEAGTQQPATSGSPGAILCGLPGGEGMLRDLPAGCGQAYETRTSPPARLS